jgi:anti-sigma B factor antagonist
MNFETKQHNSEAIIQTKVEKLDATNASELKAEMIILNKNGINNIILNLENTKYCDSSGLSAILAGNRLCKDTNGFFVLCGLQASVFKMIQIAQLDKVLLIANSVEEALKEIH